MIDLEPLLTLSFWIEKKPPLLTSPFQQLFFYSFGAMVVLALIISILVKQKKKTDPWIAKGFQKISSWCLTMGIAGLIILFFSFEQVVFLSMRLGYIIWLVAALSWLAWIVIFFIHVVPRKKAEIKKKEELKKYIPTRK